MRNTTAVWVVVAMGAGYWSGGWIGANDATPARLEGWTPGKGWGWVWGPEDEIGSLNAISKSSVLNALQQAKEGKIYDLGVTFDRTSFKWPGHNANEVMTFRSPEGVKRQKDFAAHDNAAGTAWHSCALFMSDNVGTQIDALGHIATGEDNHWYNGFKETDRGGDWGLRSCAADTIPPVVTRGVLVDIAGYKNVDALPSSYSISAADVEGATRRQGTVLQPGDTVLLRTGSLRYWDATGANHEKLAEHDSAGLSLEAAKFLVEQQGAIMIGSDTSGLERQPAPKGSKSFVPVHEYLLVEQGVHIAELHYLEDLARDRVYEFCYIALVNKIKGATAGFCMRPVAIR